MKTTLSQFEALKEKEKNILGMSEMLKKESVVASSIQFKSFQKYFHQKRLVDISRKSFYDSTFLRKYTEQNVQSRVKCNVILHRKVIKFLQVGELGAGFRLRKNHFALCRNTKKSSLVLTTS